MRGIFWVFFILAMIIPCSVLACSFAPGAERFNFKPTGEGEAIEAPQIEVKRLVRGHDDGNYASCSDAGILVFSVDLDLDVGYEFSVAEGGFPDLVFPEFPVRPVSDQPGELRFVWLDFQDGPIEPIEAVVEVRAVSETGVRSEPVIIEILDPGES